MELQEDMLRYARKIVCVYATHGKNACDFQLVTVLVVDDYHKGIPVAFSLRAQLKGNYGN